MLSIELLGCQLQGKYQKMKQETEEEMAISCPEEELSLLRPVGVGKINCYKLE